MGITVTTSGASQYESLVSSNVNAQTPNSVQEPSKHISVLTHYSSVVQSGSGVAVGVGATAGIHSPVLFST